MFKVRTIHFVTKRVFAVALSEYFFCEGQLLWKNITKTKAKEILKEHLFFHGIGSRFAGLDNIGCEPQEQLNRLYENAKNWVVKNYPYLDNIHK